MYNPEKHDIKPFEKTLYLASPTIHRNTDSYDELKFMQEAFETNWLSPVGANINECERMKAEKVGEKYAVGLSCRIAALHLAMKFAGAKRKGIPIFIDTEYDTWNMDPVALEKAFELYLEAQKIVVVAHSHLYGTPGKLDELKAVCDKYNAVIVEDAAESSGAT